MTNGNFIAYYRVSTQQQGASGLGIEAQRAAVAGYLKAGDWKVIAEFTEVESGKVAERPELDKALAMGRLHRIPVVVAKVDRLTRSVAFLSRLLEAGAEVRFCDLPAIEGPTGRFILQQMAAVAELEAGLISARTKAALAAAKARGVKLGGGRGVKISYEAQMKGVRSRVARAKARAKDLEPIIKRIVESPSFQAKPSYKRVAEELNALNIPTSCGGGKWLGPGVKRMMGYVGA